MNNKNLESKCKHSVVMLLKITKKKEEIIHYGECQDCFGRLNIDTSKYSINKEGLYERYEGKGF